MLKKQLLLVATIVGLAVGIYVILQLLNWDNPHTDISNTITPKDLLIKSMSSEKLISTDELATRIINEDPSYVLIDLRDKAAFDKFTLPRAKNIAPDHILDETYKPIFDTDAHNVVLFSNGTLIANKVWMLLRREGYRNVMVLDGGLNMFYKTIMNPTKPKAVDSEDAFDLYRFRKAAGVYFGLPNPDEFIPAKTTAPEEAPKRVRNNTAQPKKTVTVQRKVVPKKVVEEEEEEEDEGC